MFIDKDKEFNLQVFQQAISTLSLYPLRLYKNDNYDSFIYNPKVQSALKRIHKNLQIKEPFNSDKLVKKIKYEIKNNPKNIDDTIYKELEDLGNLLRVKIWQTKPSNSLTFTRDIKENKKLWLYLMFYDLMSKEYIDKNFKKPFNRYCLIGMYNVYIKLNKKLTLSIGRVITKEQDSDKIVSNLLKNYDFDNMNIFELTKISRRRKIFDKKTIKKQALHIQNSFRIFLESIDKLPPNMEKEEIEKVAIFIYMVVENNLLNSQIYTGKYRLTYKLGKLKIDKKDIKNSKLSNELFQKQVRKFENHRDYFLGEYTLRIKTTFNKKYSGVKHVGANIGFNPINELIERICSRLLADGGYYITYSIENERIELKASYGEQAYEDGIKRYIEQINSKDELAVKKSSVLNVINNYLNSNGEYSIDSLILQKVDKDNILQPIKDKPILSNIAIPVTFRYKLMGVLLIDSFRANAFTKDDIDLILSITSAMSMPIFDQIIEANLFRIIKNIPNKAELRDKELIQNRFINLSKNINKIFFSYGVSIWGFDQDELSFELKSTTLPVKPDSIKVKPNSNDIILDLTNKHYIENFEPLIEYNIKSSSRFVCCNPREYDKRVNAVKIYPIVDNGKLLGAFSIYNKKERDYKAIDIQSLDSVKEHLKLFFNITSTFMQQRALIEDNALHEISKKLIMIKTKTNQLRNILYRDFVQLDSLTRHRFNIKLDDIKNFTQDIRYSFDFISNRKDDYKHKNFIDVEVDKKYRLSQKEVEGTQNIREIMNKLMNSIPPLLKSKKIIIVNKIDNLELKVSHIVINDIFQNLLLNAIKYSYQGTEIKITSKVKSNSVRVYIKNEGLDIKKDEINDIFKYGYRCLVAKKFKEKIGKREVSYPDGKRENAGIGLYKVETILRNVLSGEIKVNVQKSNIKGGAVVEFEVILPKTLLYSKKEDI